MEVLADVARLEAYVLLGGFALVVAYKLLTGRINMAGIFSDKVTREPSPGRVQMLFFTVVGAGYYLMLVLEQASSGSLPDVPMELLLLVGGSQLFYLGAKTRSHFFPIIGGD